MKKLLSLLLCLCLVLGALLCLASCKTKKTDPIDLTDYKLIYEGDYKNIFSTWAKDFGATMSEYTGLKISAGTDGGLAGEKEILLGYTDRPESAELAGKIEGEGYAYGVINGKLVLVGTSKLMTLLAVESFTQNCLTQKGSTSVTVEETVVSNAPTVEITASYSIVYNQDWDDDKNTGNRLPNNDFKTDEKEFTNRDHGVVMAEHVRDALKSAIKTTSSTALLFTSDKKEASKREVVVGIGNRDVTRQFLKTIDIDGYGVALYDQTVVVTGYNDNGLRQAVDMFKQLVELGSTTNADGKKVVVWPAGLRMASSKNFGWEIDVPRPQGENIDLAGSVDVGEGSVEFYYTGKGVNADAFNTYCAGLKEAGYVLIQENSWEGSIFRLYRNKSTNVQLYTAYAAYTHATAQNVKLYEPCIRVVTSSTKDVGSDFSESLLTPAYNDYSKLTNTRLTCVRLNYQTDGSVYGNLYVMQLEDGSFIVQDGGFVRGNSVTRLYNVLSDLHRRATGTSPSVSNPIVIAAWYLSHGHGDHTGNFLELCQDYGNKVNMELLIANNPSDLESYNCGDPNLYVRNNLSQISNYTGSHTKYVKVHTGMKMFLRNVEIDVLYTHEDIYPQTFERFNNSSTVLRTTIHNTNGSGAVEGKDTAILWLGDLMTRGSACLRAMYGSFLKTEMVQIAHHGGSGCELELYKLTEAKVLIWPHSSARVTEMSKNSTAKRGTSAYVSYHTIHMDTVEYVLISDIYNTTVTFTKNGYDMSVGGAYGLFNAGESAAIQISNKFDETQSVIKLK